MTLLLLVLISIIIYYFFIYRGEVLSTFNPFRGKRCPNCHNSVEESFNVCPVCKETLKRKCSGCNEKINVSWKYCPYCEKPANERRQ